MIEARQPDNLHPHSPCGKEIKNRNRVIGQTYFFATPATLKSIAVKAHSLSAAATQSDQIDKVPTFNISFNLFREHNTTQQYNALYQVTAIEP